MFSQTSKPWQNRTTADPVRRTWTGRIVYDRKKNSFQPLDVLRIVEKWKARDANEHPADYFAYYLIFVKMMKLCGDNFINKGYFASMRLLDMNTEYHNKKSLLEHDEYKKMRRVMKKYYPGEFESMAEAYIDATIKGIVDQYKEFFSVVETIFGKFL